LLTAANATDIKLLWKTKLDNAPRAMHALLPALVASGVTTSQGVREIAVIAGSSDNLYGLDAENGSSLWKRHFDNPFPPDEQGSAVVLCPGGLTAHR
jgi:outer membrane protein assembly factor BamB